MGAGFAAASFTLLHFRVYTFGVRYAFVHKWEDKHILHVGEHLLLLDISGSTMAVKVGRTKWSDRNLWWQVVG